MSTETRSEMPSIVRRLSNTDVVKLRWPQVNAQLTKDCTCFRSGLSLRQTLKDDSSLLTSTIERSRLFDIPTATSPSWHRVPAHAEAYIRAHGRRHYGSEWKPRPPGILHASAQRTRHFVPGRNSKIPGSPIKPHLPGVETRVV